MILLQMLWSTGASLAALYCFWRAAGTWKADVVRRTARDEFFFRYFRWHYMLLRLTSGIAWFLSAVYVWDSWRKGFAAAWAVALIWIFSIPLAWLVMGFLYARKFGARR